MQIKLEEKIRRISPDKFLGKIHSNWARRIVGLIEGNKVLEIGCGYGFLTDHLSRQGFSACGIDIDQEAITVGRSLFPQADLRISDAYNLPFADNSFDTVVFHEVVHHLDLEKAFKEAHRLTKNCVIIFDPNPNLIVKLCRKMVRHIDPEAPFDQVSKTLERQGLEITSLGFSDLFAMPLSGGFVGPRLVPDLPALHNFLIKLDQAVCNILKAVGCERFFCWRYLIKAQKAR
ncbi:MAG: class I SAM-dependent methyltransferase [Candidatus Omnitrophota bacterium]